jgi:hypothetical protein
MPNKIYTNINIGVSEAEKVLNINSDGDVVTAYPKTPSSVSFGGGLSKLPGEEVLFDFQPGHGWTNGTVNGSISDDTVDYTFGNQSLKVVTDGLGNPTRPRITGINLNLSDRDFYLYLKVKNSQNLQSLSWFLYSNAGLTIYYNFIVGSDLSYFTRNENIYLKIPLSLSKVSTAGNVNIANIVASQFSVIDKGTGPVELNIQKIVSVERQNEGVVSVVFDDSWKTDFTVAKPEMDKYNFKGTSYVIPDSLGSTEGSVGKMTLDEVKILQASGWQIAAHDEPDYLTLTPQEAEKRIVNLKNFFQENGFGDTSCDFAWPLGRYSPELINIAKKYFRSLRTIHELAETQSTPDRYRLKILNITEADTSENVLSAIQKCKAEKSWLIILYHYIDSVPGSIGITPAKFIEQIGYLDSEGVTVKTIKEVLDSDYSLKNEIESVGYTNEVNPSDHGLLAWNYDPVTASATYQPSSGTLQLYRIYLQKPITISNIHIYITAGTSMSNCYGALFDSSGSLLAQSTDQSASFGSSGLKTIPITPQSVSAGFIDVGIWVNTTGTQVAVHRAAGSNIVNVGLSAPNFRYATADTGLTATAPLVVGTKTGLNFGAWCAVS